MMCLLTEQIGGSDGRRDVLMGRAVRA
jgi:hypothetical protein